MGVRLISDGVEEARIREAYRRRASADINARYSYFDIAHLLNQQQLERVLLSSLRDLGYAALNDQAILEVGCGTGTWLQKFLLWGASPDKVAGIDLQATRIAAAREALPAKVNLHCGNAEELPFPDSSFDLAFQATAFTSIFSGEMKRRIAGEMVRVLKPGRHLVWYDFFVNNPRNRDVRGIGKREVMSLFEGCRAKFVRVTLAPPLGRVLGRISPVLCALALHSGLLCTHYVAFLEKP